MNAFSIVGKITDMPMLKETSNGLKTFFAFAKGMLKDAGAAEDIIQNVFMKVMM